MSKIDDILADKRKQEEDEKRKEISNAIHSLKMIVLKPLYFFGLILLIVLSIFGYYYFGECNNNLQKSYVLTFELIVKTGIPSLVAWCLLKK